MTPKLTGILDLATPACQIAAAPTPQQSNGFTLFARLVRHELTLPLLLLGLGVAPWSFHFLLMYPDERFYLDAALTMHQTGDWLVPRYDDGSPRLNKPLLTYWVLLVSFRVLGANIVAARLPFVLAAVGQLVLTWRLARVVTPDPRAARLAVWVLLANPLFLLCAVRCLPDILLTLFASLAVYGYFRLRRANWSDTGGAWWFALGIGLASATKGLPALLLIGCIGLHSLLDLPHLRNLRLRKLALPAATGIAVGLAGFLPIMWHHAQETVQEMWHDQFAQRLVYQVSDVVHRLPLLVLGLAALHLAWLLPAARGFWAAARWELRPGSWHHFLATTLLLWIAATVATENCSPRYVTPLLPWIAIALASAIMSCDGHFLLRYGRWCSAL
ncbi:MAG: glycosyltransferase family 39 protein, partial [Gemmataceae bacterium]|nr:glycosyltransferase family 39 protein [Gemmataceae bacterium]